jgi:nitroreductase/NAD-dependent dihydropyrimidine dehydrogenase PreA subunit
MRRVYIDQDRCILCGSCFAVCVRRIIVEGKKAAKITNPDLCLQCGHCKAICPENAPQLPELDPNEFGPTPESMELPSPDHLMNLFRSRRSIRLYARKPLERDKVERIIQAGRFAPSGTNRQSLHYVVILSAEKLEFIRNMALEALFNLADILEKVMQNHQEEGEPIPQRYEVRKDYVGSWRNLMKSSQEGVDRLFYRAPAVVACHFDPMSATTPEVDPGLAAMQMVLMAEALGVGTCFSSFFAFAVDESEELREVLHIPLNHKVPFSFVAGYPDVNYIRYTARKSAKVEWL